MRAQVAAGAQDDGPWPRRRKRCVTGRQWCAGMVAFRGDGGRHSGRGRAAATQPAAPGDSALAGISSCCSLRVRRHTALVASGGSEGAVLWDDA